MMSKERLEEVNHIYEYIKRANDEEDSCNVEQSLNELFSKGFIDWLIKQAERVQELEELEQEYVDLNSDFTKLALENKRYREVMEKAIEMIRDSTGTITKPREISLYDALKIKDTLLETMEESE